MSINFKISKKLFLLDQDGTLYKGNNLFPETISFLEKIRNYGASYLFITNNSSKSIHEYVKKMAQFGISAHPGEFYTSAHATIDYLHNNYTNKIVFLVGTVALSQEFMEKGIILTDDIKLAEVAVLSYDTELTYRKLTSLCHLLRNKDIPYLATNPDLVCPTEDGYLPDCGSFALMIEEATKRTPLFLGKPRPLFVESILTKFGVAKDEVVIVGDRLYTDIAMGTNAGVETILVLSGEATRDDLISSEHIPTFVVNNIGDIL